MSWDGFIRFIRDNPAVACSTITAPGNNESVGAGYIERNWRPGLKESGAWPLANLRQSFLDGSLSVTVKTGVTQSFQTDLQEILDHLWPADRVRIEPTRRMNP